MSGRLDQARKLAASSPALRLLLVAGLFLALTAVWLAPVVADVGGRMLGEPNDGSGTLREAWAAQAQGETVFTWTRDDLAVAPEGTPRSRAVAIANGLYPAVLLALEPLVGWIAAWNLLLIAGFVATGVASFALLERLRLVPLPAFFGAYAITFNAFAFEKALFGQAAYVHVWIFPVLLLALMRMRERATSRTAVLVGLAVALAFYLQSYYGLLALFVTGVFLAVDLGQRALRGAPLRRPLALGGVAVLAALAAFAPALVYWARERDRVAELVSRPVEDLTELAATLSTYLLPSGRHPLLGGLGESSSQSTSGEPTLFFGYSTLVLAAVGLALLLREHPALVADPTRRFMAWFAVVLVPLALVTSLPREVDALGVPVPTPSFLVGELVSYWRVYARFGLLVGIGLVLLAAMALHVLVRRRGGAIVAAAALAVLAFELAPGWPVPSWAAGERPPIARWLAEHPGGVVAFYPQAETPDAFLYLMNREYARQRFHGHPLYDLWGGGWTGTRAEAIRILTRNPEDPLTPGVLAAQGVRYIVLRDDGYRLAGRPPPPLPAEGYRFAVRLPGATVYEVTARPVDLDATLQANLRRIGLARALPRSSVMFASGFHPPEAGSDGLPARWLVQGGRLVVDNRGPEGEFLLTASTLANGAPRTLLLEDDDGRELGRVEAAPFAQTATIGPLRLPEGRSTVVLRAVPGPQPLGSDDDRQATVLVSGVELLPLGDFAVR